MPPRRPLSAPASVHERYRHLLHSGFTQTEAAGLLAHASGIDHHREGEPSCGAAWTWQQVARIEFLRYLVETDRLHG